MSGAAATEVPTGNTFDKYGSQNPVVRRLMSGFHAHARRALGAGGAVVGARRGLRRGRAHARVGGAAGRRPDRGIDLEDPKLRAEWARRERPNLEFRAEEATRLSFADGEFELAAAIEVLEHVPEPEATLAEMARVATRPPARVGAARAALARPQHGARRLLARPRQHARPREPLVQARVRLAAVALRRRSRRPARPSPGPCCLSASSRSSYGRGAAILSVGIGATGLITFAYFSLASHALPEDEYGRITLLWSAVFITVSVLYRPVEQLLSRTIADHDARGVTGTEHLRVAATIQLALGVVFVVGGAAAARADRGRPVRRLLDALLDPRRGRAGVRGQLLRARLPRRPPPVPALRRAGADGGDLALPVRAGRGRGIAEGQTAVALGMAAAPIVSLAVVPPALARRLARATATAAGRRRPRPARRGRARGARGARAGVHARSRHAASRRPCCCDALRADLPERRARCS